MQFHPSANPTFLFFFFLNEILLSLPMAMVYWVALVYLLNQFLLVDICSLCSLRKIKVPLFYEQK